MIHVSWTLRPSRAGYTQDTLEIHCKYIQDTYPGLVLSALRPKEFKALRLFVARVGRHVWSTLKGGQQLSTSPLPSLLQRIRLNRLELKAHVEQLYHVVDGQHVGADAARHAF